MRQYHAVMIKLDTEQAAREFLQDRTGYFNAIFLAHNPFDCGPVAPGKPAREDV